MSAEMTALAAQQPGFLGMESARDQQSAQALGITVSYWADEAAARAWKQVGAHLIAQRRGRDVWYRDYRVRVAVVQREYGMVENDLRTP
jgi:heme-degrading monooxygenase HmoA